MSKRIPPNITVIPVQPADLSPAPPGELDPYGMALWHEVTRIFSFDDPSSYECLFQACSARARAERCRKLIDEQGEMLRTKMGLRDHPLIKHEIAARALCVRLLARLGMDLEPLRSGPGRPPGR